jgi:hypothetical protein
VRGHYKLPQGVHPIVHRLFVELNNRGEPLVKIQEESGVNHATIKNWRNRQRATLENIDAVFNTLGYKLSVTKLEEGAV